MKSSALKTLPLHCPRCALKSENDSVLILPDSAAADIENGSLCCPHCSAMYEIRDGILTLTTLTSNKVYLDDVDQSSECWLCIHFADAIKKQIPQYILKENDLTGYFAESEDQYYKELMEMLTPCLSKETLFLDVGCAMGRLALEAGLKVKFAYGIDPSPVCIHAARDILRFGSMKLSFGTINLPELKNSRSEFIICDDSSLPFAPETFDCVCCSSVIDRVPDANAFLKRVDRIVKKDGYLVITDPFDWNPEYSKEELWFGRGAFGTKNDKEEDALAELLERYGYERVTEKNIRWKTFSHRRNHKVWMVYAGIFRKRA